MKKFIITLGLAMTFAISAFAGERIDPKGDDLFPWPWGTECPFPWKEIEGGYYVRAAKTAQYSGHLMYFEVKKSNNASMRYLNVTQYNRNGFIYARGKASAEKDQRIVKGVMRTEETGREFVVMVRTYENSKTSACRANDMVTAITYCPMRGRKCMDDANYVLEKLEQ
jgi:hypothetical protein